MTSLAEALAEDLTPRGRCQFRDWRETFTPEEDAMLVAAFESEMTDSELTRRLIKAGCPVSNHRVTDHRRGRCKVCQ